MGNSIQNLEHPQLAGRIAAATDAIEANRDQFWANTDLPEHMHDTANYLAGIVRRIARISVPPTIEQALSLLPYEAALELGQIVEESRIAEVRSPYPGVSTNRSRDEARRIIKYPKERSDGED